MSLISILQRLISGGSVVGRHVIAQMSRAGKTAASTPEGGPPPTPEVAQRLAESYSEAYAGGVPQLIGVRLHLPPLRCCTYALGGGIARTLNVRATCLCGVIRQW